MLYSLIRKFFFSLDPEMAHGLGMNGVDFLNRANAAAGAPDAVKVVQERQDQRRGGKDDQLRALGPARRRAAGA